MICSWSRLKMKARAAARLPDAMCLRKNGTGSELSKVAFDRIFGTVLTSAAFVFAATVQPAIAQPVEQYPAPVLKGERISSLPGHTEAEQEVDDTPLGVDLSGVLIVSDRNALVPVTAVKGVKVESDRAVLNDPALRKRLQPFIGRPLSLRLVAQIRDSVTAYVRKKGRPLVAVIAPPQEITAGALQLLVIPYRLGERHVERIATGHEMTPQDKLLERVRLRPGDEVDTDGLLSDVNWLLRNPFRSIGVVFEPGEAVDTTDMTLRLTESKPWRIFAGTANSGTEETYRSRVFAGFVAANPIAFDHRIAYQITAAPKTLYSQGELFNFDGDKAYLAHSASYYLPLDWRHILTFDASYVRTRSDLGLFFDEESKTWQARFDYAVPMLRLNGQPDLFAGFEFKRQKSDLLFLGDSVSSSNIDIAQFVIGARGRTNTAQNTTRYDLDVYLSPGGLSNDNTDAVFAAVTGDPQASARYVYANVVLEHRQVLPRDFALNFNFGGQLSNTLLPQTERFGIGGIGSVRGFETNELSGDNGFYAQGEIRLPSVDDPYLPLRFSPFAFFDTGSVGSWNGGTTGTIASTGLGMDIDFTDRFHASLNAAFALTSGSDTAAGDAWIHFNLTSSY
ncbi:ShlB/FhaC/HecB family hemolysin secretion/activation protein [Hoeflea prorocentri]|uniref:BamA/TamA family outer membrane protein n=1 Tax=Hoeflea prorocentri TaxID=1922333 RepID=A0A9X3ZFA2_9HYPH|nr:ShlB/FhaC/HecB family hemolysin secretion/activation protein [Hoeflea prorocentri]MCY6379421.1 BamA/TamA family outer membrane protein [Hoeflea prorocentri]MDA5397222.1 BamA/TamA family outer membrane protein [Hoeflea prorocentri]